MTVVHIRCRAAPNMPSVVILSLSRRLVLHEVRSEACVNE